MPGGTVRRNPNVTISMNFRAIPAACVLAAVTACAPQGRASQQPTAAPPSPASNLGTAAPVSRGAAAAPLATPVPAERPASSPTNAPTIAPTIAPTLAPAVKPSAVPTAAPSATPAVLPANAAPEIMSLSLDRTVVHAGDTVSGTVVTSSNVASVEARIATYSIDVPKVGEGRFALSYTVPNLPFFLRKTYDMEVIARNTAGVETTRSVPITIR